MRGGCNNFIERQAFKVYKKLIWISISLFYQVDVYVSHLYNQLSNKNNILYRNKKVIPFYFIFYLTQVEKFLVYLALGK